MAQLVGADFNLINNFGMSSKYIDDIGYSKSIEKISNFGLGSKFDDHLDIVKSASAIEAIDFLKTIGAFDNDLIARGLSISKINFSASEAILNISNLKTFEALASLENSPFKMLGIEPDFYNNFDLNFYKNRSIDDIGNEIYEDISGHDDFNLLPEDTKKSIRHLYYVYILPIVINIFCTLLLNYVAEANKELEVAKSASDVKSIIKNNGSKFDRLVLESYRVTIGSNLNLRVSPSKKSDITYVLPIGTLVQVIDKSNKSWVKIEVEIDGENVQGWVYRRYTKPVRKF